MASARSNWSRHSRTFAVSVLLSTILWLFFQQTPPRSVHTYDTYNVVDHVQGNYAYAFFLAKPSGKFATGREEDDLYFIQTRMMIWQLLHDPATKTIGYPVVVLVTEDVSESKRNRLQRDGAEVIEVTKIKFDWIHTATPAWQDVLAKLHLFNLVQFDKVAFFDSDTIFTRPMDDVFNDPAAQLAYTLRNSSNAPEDEGPQPETYIFAGNAGAGIRDHAYPPYKGDNLNAGCMVYQPSREMFEYYLRICNLTDRFPRKYPEQGLWAYAHRWQGNMPWKQLHYAWNINWVTSKDLGYGVASLHMKMWEGQDDLVLTDYIQRIRSKMEGYWYGMESSLQLQT